MQGGGFNSYLALRKPHKQQDGKRKEVVAQAAWVYQDNGIPVAKRNRRLTAWTVHKNFLTYAGWKVIRLIFNNTS